MGMRMEDVLSRYKASFHRFWSEERYKWEAVQHYQTHWHIDAPDFAAMLAESFSKAGNLLSGGMYYPYRMIVAFAREEPETVRALFRQLYDESRPLAERYAAFRTGCGQCLLRYRAANGSRDRAQKHYQDLRAVSVYLSFEYPDTYFLYMYKIYTRFRDLVGFQEHGARASEIWRLENYNRLCREVLEAIQSDPELLEMQRRALDSACWPDRAFHLLAQTVMYAGSFLRADEALSAEPPEPAHAAGAEAVTDIAKNTILYGPPGTGKTYHTVFYAVAIIENRPLASVQAEDYRDVLARYRKYREAGLIEFTTFHQSCGYEEFIEGIRPVMQEEQEGQEDSGEIRYRIAPGLFKRFCDKASQLVLQNESAFGLNASPVVWKVSLGGTGENEVRSECMERGHIRIGCDEYGEAITSETNYSNGGKVVLNAFLNKMRVGDVVLSCYSASTIDAVGVVTGEYEWHDEYAHYKRLRPVQWLARGIRRNIVDMNNGMNMTLSTVYRLGISVNDVLEIVREAAEPSVSAVAQKQNHVFIIDEINRGNISKIFGELITLIEPSKRLGQPEGMRAVLPYSGKAFGVPDNVYLLGTMNTADRSIAMLDTALRRRFQFREMLPDPGVLAGISVEDLSISDLLARMNEKICVLYDREHTIGHACFLPLASSPTIETLAAIFEHSVLPLLQEYFYEDYEKIRLVLGDNNKPEPDDQFILAIPTDFGALFGTADVDLAENIRYEINPTAFDNIEAYRSI